jgi:hypothetical protein
MVVPSHLSIPICPAARRVDKTVVCPDVLRMGAALFFGEGYPCTAAQSIKNLRIHFELAWCRRYNACVALNSFHDRNAQFAVVTGHLALAILLFAPHRAFSTLAACQVTLSTIEKAIAENAALSTVNVGEHLACRLVVRNSTPNCILPVQRGEPQRIL